MFLSGRSDWIDSQIEPQNDERGTSEKGDTAP
jgi:hypothetical protein